MSYNALSYFGRVLELKVLLYFENSDKISKSGIGKALEHQKKALASAGVEYTTDPDDDYDILHINTIFFKSDEIIRQARKKGAAVIYHAHSTEEDFRNSFVFTNTISKAFGKYICNLYGKADYVITPTPYSKSLVEKCGVPVEAVSNGIDLNRFKKDPESEKAFREYFKLKPEDKVVISAGLWIKRKGILDFIETARLLPDVKFLWFGSANLMAIPTEIRNAILKDHPDNVIFPGYMTGDVYRGAYSGADMFFFPSLEETEGIVVLEALACKQAVLLRDIPVYGGWMKDGYNCWKGKTNEEFASIIRKELNGELLDLSENGYKTAEERSIENVGKKLREIYEYVYNDAVTKLIRQYSTKNTGKNVLNIGLFSDSYTPDINGVSVSVATLRTQLERMGHNVYVITPFLHTKLVGTEFDSGILRIPAIKLKQLYGYRLSRPYSIRALEYIKSMNLDVIHVHTEFSMRILAKAASSLYKIPMVSTYHTMYEDYTHYITKGHLEASSKKVVGWYTKRMLDKKGEVIVPSEKTYKVLKNYGVTKQMQIIPTGIDTQRFAPSNADKEFVKKFLTDNKLKDKFRMIYIGRLAPEKSLETILNAMPAIIAKIPEAFLLVVGYGPSMDAQKELVESLGISGNVLFCGKQPPETIQNYYALGDVFVTASTSETQGITYIEAMAAGLPVIARYDECLKSVLIEGCTGYTFASDGEFTEKLLLYYKNSKEKKAEMKFEALAKAAEFSLETFGESILKVYYRAIKKNCIREAAQSAEYRKEHKLI